MPKLHKLQCTLMAIKLKQTYKLFEYKRGAKVKCFKQIFYQILTNFRNYLYVIEYEIEHGTQNWVNL
jgi:hypothetical protein